MASDRTVTVFGAYGHTGRFVVSELCKRVVAGEAFDAQDFLEALSPEHLSFEIR